MSDIQQIYVILKIFIIFCRFSKFLNARNFSQNLPILMILSLN